MERKLLEQEQIDETLEKLPSEGYNRIKSHSHIIMDKKISEVQIWIDEVLNNK